MMNLDHDAWLTPEDPGDEAAGNYGFRNLAADKANMHRRDAQLSHFAVGACCEACAQTKPVDEWTVGAACCSECEKTGKTCQVYEVGYVNDLQVNKLDAAINALDKEVAALDAEMTKPATNDAKGNSDSQKNVFIKGKKLSDLSGEARGQFAVDFADFATRWHDFLSGGAPGIGWYAWLASSSGVTSRLLDDNEFAAWTSKYGQAYREWTEKLGQSSKAPAPGSKDLAGPGGDPDGGLKMPSWGYPLIVVGALVALAPILAPFAGVLAMKLGKVTV